MVDPWHVIEVGLTVLIFGAVITLAGVWLLRSVPDSQTAIQPSSGSPTEMTIDGLDTVSPGPTEEAEVAQPKPKRFLWPADKERLSEALYELSQINTNDLGAINKEGGEIVVPWQNVDPSLDAAAAEKTIQRILKMDADVEKVRTEIYRKWLVKYNPYSDILNEILGYGITDGIHPLNEFQVSFQKMIGVLNNYKEIHKRYSLTKPDQDLNHLMLATSEEVRRKVGNLVDWMVRNETRIKKARTEFVDG